MEKYESCYTFKKITYTDGLFNKSIDATYIIHLDGNGRLDSINKQLSDYHITNTVYILFNKGFKKCKKELKLQRSDYDLIDANIEIFNHSKKNNYSNILILEDDFIFNKHIKSSIHINNINNYLIKNSHAKFVYHLGAIPFFVIPHNLYTYKSICFATHATVFTKKSQDYIIEYFSKKYIDDWDIFILKHIPRYIYYRPLCYQTIPETENKSNWSLPPILADINTKIIKLLNLNNEVEPGTTYIYMFAKIVSIITFIFIIFIIYILLSYLKIFKQYTKVFKSHRLK